MGLLTINDVDLKNKRVLIRDDFNVPLEAGEVCSDVRIKAALPSIQLALQSNAAVMLMSHFCRPTEGKFDACYSLEPVARCLSSVLGREVPLIRDWIDGVDVEPGQVVLLENTRFNIGEKENSDLLSRKMANLCDVYVNDAFATAHRKEASTYGVAKYAPVVCIGLLMKQELDALNKVMKDPARPLIAIVGGAKVSTKLLMLNSIAPIVDYLIVGGGIANTFIAAEGCSIGKSLYEPELVKQAAQIKEMAETLNVQIPLPIDVVVAKELSEDAESRICLVSDVHEDEMILDIGPKTCDMLTALIEKANTILWNGPVGAFECAPFAEGTERVAHAIAESNAYSVAGGGDTILAMERTGVSDKISYISTGGGAFLSYLEGSSLPAISVIQARS